MDDLQHNQIALKLALQVINSSSDIIVISEASLIDKPGPRIVYVNEAFVRETGYSVEEVIGKTPRILQGPKTDQATSRRIRAALEKWQPIREEVLNYKKNGETFWQSLNIFPVADDGGHFTHWVAIQHNITERKLAELANLNLQQSFQTAMKAGGIGIWEWDIVNDFLTWNSGMYLLYGISEQNFPNTYESWQNAVHPEDRIRVDQEIREAIKLEVFYSEFRVVLPNQTIRDICAHAIVIKDTLGLAQRMIGTNWDISEIRERQVSVEKMAFFDHLTTLPNQRLFNDRLSQALLMSQRMKNYGALIFIDLDKFKFINDEYGHLAGDWLLIEVAKRITKCLRKTDTASRYGGDEFIVLLGDLSANKGDATLELQKIAENIKNSLGSPYSIPILDAKPEGKPILCRCSASIGSSLFFGLQSNSLKLIHEVDRLMYEAKTDGGNRVKISKKYLDMAIGDAGLEKDKSAAEKLNLIQDNIYFKFSERKYKNLENKIDDSQYEAINLLVALAVSRDDETGGHLIRTQKYNFAIGTRLLQLGFYVDQLDNNLIEMISRAAPLHDIGKVAIPDSILRKPSHLTEEEWEIMRTHTSLGASILHSTKKNGKFQNEVIRIAADIAASHHEKWNGTGYPAGLSGEDIPLSARIMALSDMYDALVSVRPYKKSWTHEQAAEEIIRNKNVAFDPLIVEAFVLEKDNFKEIKNKFRDSSNLEKFKS
jgi:diguanylate cyclase (GGDEF)-like protein/PAS domain S-box-containing protein